MTKTKTFEIWGRGYDKAAFELIETKGQWVRAPGSMNSPASSATTPWRATITCTESELYAATTFFSRRVRGWKEVA